MSTSARPVIDELRWAVPPASQDEFDRWYDEEHLAEVCAVPGIARGRRFVRVDAPYSSKTDYGHLTLYEADSLAVFDTAAYRRLAEAPSEWTRRVAASIPRTRERATLLGSPAAGPEPGRAIVHVLTRVDEAIRSAFHAWYDEEHLPLLASVPGVRSARRYRIEQAEPAGWDFIALYELDDVAVALSEEWLEKGRRTPRREKLGSGMESHVQIYREIRRLTA